MAFARVVAGWGAILIVFLLWQLLEHRAQSRPEPVWAGLRRELRTLAIEAGLLALLTALWFASLGGGSGWLVFLLVGLLVECPAALRASRVSGEPVAWVPLAGRVGRIVVAGMAAGVILTR